MRQRVVHPGKKAISVFRLAYDTANTAHAIISPATQLERKGAKHAKKETRGEKAKGQIEKDASVCHTSPVQRN
jgi:hypothetical protein